MNEFNLRDKVAVITGGAGIICSVMARSLAAQGVKCAVLDLNREAALRVSSDIEKDLGIATLGISANVLDKASLIAAKKEINDKFGPIDILVNGAGGNSPAGTTKVEKMDGTVNENLEDTFFGLQI